MVSNVELLGLVYVATGLVEVLFLRFALANRDKPGSLGFAMTVVGISIWSTVVGAGVFLPSIGASVLAFEFQLLGSQLAFVGWFLLALEFVNPDRLTTRVKRGMAAFIAVTFLGLWTNPLHGFIWTDPRIEGGGFLEVTFQAGWWVFAGAHYLLLVVALGLLVWVFLRASGAKRLQAGAFALATLPVFVTTVVTIWDVFGVVDTTPFGYLVVFPIVAWALYRARFLDVLPVARRTVVEEMQDAVVILDEDDQVADFNSAAGSLLGLSRSSIGQSAAAVFERYQDTAREFVDAEQIETEVTVDDDGVERQFHLTISPLGGEAAGGGRVVVLREITTLKRREAELRRRERQFDLLRQVLSRVLRHNLRNDLQVIRAHARRIPEADGEGVDELVETVVGKADDLASTGEKARRLERIIDSEGETIEVDVTAVVSSVVEEMRESYPDAVIETDCPEWAGAVADDHLSLAVEDLVENGIVHANDPEPEVTVSVERTDDHVVVDIADEGPGIPEEELAVLEARSESDLEHASGAGLWVVTWIVERSGGELSFDSSPEGTTATIRLPRGEGAAPGQSEDVVRSVGAESPSNTTT
jgi:PAS domain S-box-containing protein